MKLSLFTSTFLVLTLTSTNGQQELSCPYNETPTAGATCCPAGENQGAVCREISYVLLAVSGTLEEGFELRKNMDFRPYGDDTPMGRVNATFLGKALVRGYKSFLDIKNPTWREYKDEPDTLKTVNPALVPTGCDEHANRYAIYAVDARQAMNALAGEPRFLSIAPDMGLTDLTASDDLTFPDIKALANAYGQSFSGIENFDQERIAFLTVTSTWLKSTFIPNGIIRQDDNGIITDYPESTGIWSESILNANNSTHDTYPQGCGSDPAGGQVTNVDTAQDYNQCIDAAIRLQEAEYGLDENDDQIGNEAGKEFCTAEGTKECFACQQQARYGVTKNMVRFNRVLTACELEQLQVDAGVVSDNGNGPKFPLQGCSLPFPPLPANQYEPSVQCGALPPEYGSGSPTQLRLETMSWIFWAFVSLCLTIAII